MRIPLIKCMMQLFIVSLISRLDKMEAAGTMYVYAGLYNSPKFFSLIPCNV